MIEAELCLRDAKGCLAGGTALRGAIDVTYGCRRRASRPHKRSSTGSNKAMIALTATLSLGYALTTPARSNVRMMAAEVDTAAVGFGASHTSMYAAAD